MTGASLIYALISDIVALFLSAVWLLNFNFCDFFEILFDYQIEQKSRIARYQLSTLIKSQDSQQSNWKSGGIP